MTLEVHRAAGLLTAMPSPRVRSGDTVIIGVPLGPLALVVPCRVIWVSEVGFGYVTLPGHPETGEEAFRVTLERGAGGPEVRFLVVGYSRPAGLSKLATTLTHLAARRTVHRYLAAMTRLIGQVE